MQKSISSNISKQKRRALGKAVDPLIMTTWGQGRPFNDNCTYTYNDNTYQCVTGCVATGLAQILNYYQHPTNGTGSCSYDVNYNNEYTITYSEDFSQSTYDWDNMLNDYSAYNGTTTVDVHTQAVAKLMRDCGVACKMRYGVDESGAYTMDAEYALKNYFSYDGSTKFYDRANYEKEDWLNMIYNEIDNGRPILYSGTDDMGFFGHAFVVNGYDSAGNVYINWGWDGNCDGYFDIDMLTPSQNNQFNYNQNMIVVVPGFSMHTLSLSVSGFGQVNFNGINGITVRDNTKVFKVKNGSNTTLYFSPDTKRKLKSITINGTDVTSDVLDNTYTISNVISDVSVIVSFESFEDEKYTLNGHEYVNLGLTSGKYWSTINYGAEKPEDAGSYLTADESGVVATSWGISWKTPDKEDVQELLDECEWTWTNLNGAAGFSVKGPNGNTMFLPAAGAKSGDAFSGLGSLAYYQTASKNGQQTWVLQSSSTDKKIIEALLSSEGYPIRPVSTNYVEVNEANFPDENFRNWILSNSDFDAVNDGILTASELKSITYINCENKQIKDLKGIEFFTNLTHLHCSSNQLTCLDLSKNTKLKELTCWENQLSSLNLGKISTLTDLYCNNNQLHKLDVSNNSEINSIRCQNNQLTSLILGNTTKLTYLDCWKNNLTSLDLSKNTALQYIDCYSNQLTSLDVSNNTSLINLRCTENNLANIDVSKLKELKNLYLGGNLLSSIDISMLPSLKNLQCDDNKLTSIDVSKNTELTLLMCSMNQLTSLDISNNKALTTLDCFSNQLTSLDVSNHTSLTILQCHGNQIPSLDVSRLTELKWFRCELNQLTSLDVSKNTKLEILGCSYNLLPSLDLSNNTELIELYCNGLQFLPQLINLDLSHNTKLETLWCNQNQLLSLDLSHNSFLSSVILSPQMSSWIWPYAAIDIPDGIAIYVPSDFDISKVIDLQLGGVSITGNIVTINDLRFLVIANAGTEQSSVDGKTLSYNYNTGNNTVGTMRVEMVLTYTGNTTVWTDSETERTWIYSISDDNATVGVNTWLTDDITIPSTIDGKNVTTITSLAFQACSGLTSLTIPSTVTTMGDFVIGGCVGLEKLIVLAEIPPTIGDNTFIDYDVPLYVPDAAVSTYKNTDKWKRFSSIKPLSTAYQYNLTYLVDGEVYKTYTINKGDIITPEPTPTKETYVFSGWSEIPETMPDHDVIVTGTFERHFDVGHVVKVVNFIMNSNATAEELALYDVNNDTELNIGDIILIVKNILNQSNSGANSVSRRASTMCDFAQYTAAQFELKVDKNASIKNIHLVGSMTQSHQLMYEQKDNNTYAVVVYSLSNQLMKPENGRIVDVEADGGELTMQNIIVATQLGETYYYQSYGTPTGIYQFENDSKSAVIYDLKGNRLNGKALEKGIYIINGKKVIVK